MLTDTITLQQGLQLQREGKIIIFDAGSNPKDIKYHKDAVKWKNNFNQLRSKVRHISPDKIAQHYSARYIIEIASTEIEHGSSTYTWKYVRGLEVSKVATQVSTDLDNVEYVYVLVNDGYPDLVKIGMTRNSPAKRVEQINGTGSVDLWKVKFALPIKQGHSYEVEQQVHKHFASVRHHVRTHNDREMFKINAFTAFDKVREVGELFRVGDPIIY